MLVSINHIMSQTKRHRQSHRPRVFFFSTSHFKCCCCGVFVYNRTSLSSSFNSVRSKASLGFTMSMKYAYNAFWIDFFPRSSCAQNQHTHLAGTMEGSIDTVKQYHDNRDWKLAEKAGWKIN